MQKAWDCRWAQSLTAWFDGDYEDALPLVAHIRTGCPGIPESSYIDVIDTFPYIELWNLEDGCGFFEVLLGSHQKQQCTPL